MPSPNEGLYTGRMAPQTAPRPLHLGSAFTPSANASPVRRIIACLDILGFRNRLARPNGLQLVFDEYTLLRDAVREATRTINLGVLFGQPVPLVTVVPAVVVSDSVYLWADDTVDAADALVRSCGALVSEALKQDIPLRGAIARGEMIIDQATMTFLGQPMVDAYVTEQVQEWIGVALHSSCAGLRGKIEGVVDWKVPVKDPFCAQVRSLFSKKTRRLREQMPKPLLAVAWHHYLQHGEAVRKIETLRAGAGRDSKRKYDNTLKFVAAHRLPEQ